MSTCGAKRIGRIIRLKNRRVYVSQCSKCGKVYLRWKRLDENRKPVTTTVGLSKEAADATIQLMLEVRERVLNLETEGLEVPE